MDKSFRLAPLACKIARAKTCGDILSELPDWFGPFEVYRDYIDDIETRPVFVAQIQGQNIGIMALTQTTDASVDIHLLAVRPEHHGTGVGRAFVALAKEYAQRNDTTFLTVKTLGPSQENVAYERTRRFYGSWGLRL